MKKSGWHIGCSGFHYDHWRKVFYPEKLAKSKWFEYYCEYFSTVELNVTFYRFPRLPALQSWYKRSPAGFLFAVKAPRLITHYKKFLDTGNLMNDFYNVISGGLMEKLGCVLFQLPPRTAYSEETLERILADMDGNFRNVIEFRHESWWNARVYKRLAEQHICFCGMSHPLLPENVIKNTDFLYYRFHGVPNLYSSAYSLPALKRFADEVQASRKLTEAFVYFNNDIGGSAITNSLQLMKYTQMQARKRLIINP